jgi:hypothetical protein
MSSRGGTDPTGHLRDLLVQVGRSRELLDDLGAPATSRCRASRYDRRVASPPPVRTPDPIAYLLEQSDSMVTTAGQPAGVPRRPGETVGDMRGSARAAPGDRRGEPCHPRLPRAAPGTRRLRARARETSPPAQRPRARKRTAHDTRPQPLTSRTSTSSRTIARACLAAREGRKPTSGGSTLPTARRAHRCPSLPHRCRCKRPGSGQMRPLLGLSGHDDDPGPVRRFVDELAARPRAQGQCRLRDHQLRLPHPVAE